MDLNTYIDRVEDAFDDRAALLQIRLEVRADQGLEDREREIVDERIGTYLADQGKEADPFDVDSVPDDGDDVAGD